MKLTKFFLPLIILISVSLVGSIYLQYLWITEMHDNKVSEFRGRVNTALDSSKVWFLDHVSMQLPNFFAPAPQTTLFPDLSGVGLSAAGFSVSFSKAQVEAVLRKEFVKLGLKPFRFEYAVLVQAGLDDFEYKIVSDKFIRAFAAANDLNRWNFPLHPDPGSNLENLVPGMVLAVVVPGLENVIWEEMQWMIVGSLFFVIVIAGTFIITLAAIFKQRRVSRIRNDFINNMTHEFKTPIATISLAIDSMGNSRIQQNREKLDYFVGIIKEEGRKMNQHVELILESAKWERGELNLNFQEVALHEIIQECGVNFRLRLEQAQATIELNLQATNDRIKADEAHLFNVLGNLIDNALKYSKENLHLRIRTVNKGNKLLLTVSDDGIGMTKETLKRIFEKFYRAHTGNIHNVKGFGLGLNYVKTVLDAHGANIRAESTPGKGSSFFVEFKMVG